MLENGTKFGILDMYIKHIRARILYTRKNYAERIAAEDEILNYLFAHLNEGHEKDINWLDQIHHSMRGKVPSYNGLGDYETALRVQKDILDFLEPRLPSDSPILFKAKWIFRHVTAT